MQIHHMTIRPEPFEKIRSKQKDIELRLNDEKRRLIHVGDSIHFTNTVDDSQQLRTKVVALHPFQTFEELYQSLPLERCGYTTVELPVASSEDMRQYYSKEQETLHGVLGIEIELIEI